MKKLTDEDIKELMDEFDISEADVQRVEALIEENFDESKIGTFVEPHIMIGETACSRDRVMRT